MVRILFRNFSRLYFSLPCFWRIIEKQIASLSKEIKNCYIYQLFNCCICQFVKFVVPLQKL